MLAAGRGERLRPLTDTTPKPLLPVHGKALLDYAIERLQPEVDEIAVNAHWLHEQVEDHLRDRDVRVSVEQPEALGTAGALGQLRDWINGRDVLVTNADAWYDPPPSPLPRHGMELLAIDRGAPSDFGTWQYAGMCHLPWAAVKELEPVPSGLYEACWREAWATNKLELVRYHGTFIDCGTPDDYARANHGA